MFGRKAVKKPAPKAAKAAEPKAVTAATVEEKSTKRNGLTEAELMRAPASQYMSAEQLAFFRERLRETEVIEAWSKIVGDFIAAHSAPVALREGILYVRVLQPSLHYELERISKAEILRKLKQRFGGKTIRDVRFRIG